MPDPITVEVIRAAMNAAAEEMKICMLKTTYSPILNEGRDFGCAIFDAEVNMIAEAVGLPLFQGHLGWPVLATIHDRSWDDIYPGDIFIHNDPMTAAAITVVYPEDRLGVNPYGLLELHIRTEQ